MADKPSIPENLPVADRLAALAARRFRLALVVLSIVAGLARVAILDEFVRENPIAEDPWSDAGIYWQWAGQMAAGHWTSDTPFLSAPLYPYFLGVLRLAGFGLPAVYGLQIGLHLLTAAIVAVATRRRFGAPAGLLAALLFLLLTEPAVSSMRVLGNTLQLLLVALIWWRWGALAEPAHRRSRDVVLVGALVGLLALTYPATLLALPVWALWLWWSGGRDRRAGRAAVIGLAGSLLMIAPATLHNAAATGEFIPISAHAGITLRQGNGPAAEGVFTYIKDIDPRRSHMHESAQAVFQARYGRAGSWSEIDRHFRSEALAFWVHHPGKTAVLMLKKLRWFASARNYDDIMPTALEREVGLADRVVLAPLATPWLIGAALAGLIAALRRPVRFTPEWLLALLPLVAVLIFFYTSRYRLPLLPVACGLAAHTLAQPLRLGLPPGLIAALCVLPLPLLALNRSSGFDSPGLIRAAYMDSLAPALVEAGDRRAARGDLRAAQARYDAALRAKPTFAPAQRALGLLAVQRNELHIAKERLQRALELAPQDPRTASLYFNVCVALIAPLEEPVRALTQVVAAEPGDAEAGLALAWVWATSRDDPLRDFAAAEAQLAKLAEAGLDGRFEIWGIRAAIAQERGEQAAALEALDRGIALARTAGDAEAVAELQDLKQLCMAGQPLRAEPRQVRIP